MKPNLEKILNNFVGRERPMSVFSFVLKGEELERYMQQKGYNQALAELRSKIPNLVDEIVKMVVLEVEKLPNATRNEAENEKVICSDDIINNLTK